MLRRLTPPEKLTAPKMVEPDLLLAAYAAGYFPMAEAHNGPIAWYSPDPRGILPLDTFKVSRSLRQTLKKRMFEIRVNTSFEGVMRACAGRDETWISEEIIASYVELHRLGHAHSVESWKEGSLVGGLYGVSLGGAFFGESMFSRAREASKVALVWLVEHLLRQHYSLLDTQYGTPHLETFGAIEIPREAYLRILASALLNHCRFIS